MPLCMPIHGMRHCFKIPELELAGTILSLIEFIDPQIKDKNFTKSLSDVANAYIHKVQQGLPKEVELHLQSKVLGKAA